MRLDDLPAADRAAIRRGDVHSPTERSTTTARSSSHPPRARGRTRYRCASCGHAEAAYKAAERHADESGHARIDLVLEAL